MGLRFLSEWLFRCSRFIFICEIEENEVFMVMEQFVQIWKCCRIFILNLSRECRSQLFKRGKGSLTGLNLWPFTLTFWNWLHLYLLQILFSFKTTKSKQGPNLIKPNSALRYPETGNFSTPFWNWAKINLIKIYSKFWGKSMLDFLTLNFIKHRHC